MRTQNLQLHLQLRSTVENVLNDIMIQNNISATDMVEAIEHYLLRMQEAASLEYVQWAMEEKAQMEAIFQEQLQQQTEETDETLPEPILIDEED